MQRLKFLGQVLSQRSVSNIINTFGILRKNQTQGLPLPIIKFRKLEVTHAVMRKVKIVTSRKNTFSQRNMVGRVHVSQDTIRRSLKNFDLVERKKYRLHRFLPRHKQIRKTTCELLYKKLLASRKWELVVPLDERMLGLHNTKIDRRIYATSPWEICAKIMGSLARPLF